MATGLTSASGLLALLEETEPKLKIYALEKLDSIVDEFWPEISDNIQQMYACSTPSSLALDLEQRDLSGPIFFLCTVRC